MSKRELYTREILLRLYHDVKVEDCGLDGPKHKKGLHGIKEDSNRERKRRRKKGSGERGIGEECKIILIGRKR